MCNHAPVRDDPVTQWVAVGVHEVRCEVEADEIILPAIHCGDVSKDLGGVVDVDDPHLEGDGRCEPPAIGSPYGEGVISVPVLNQGCQGYRPRGGVQLDVDVLALP